MEHRKIRDLSKKVRRFKRKVAGPISVCTPVRALIRNKKALSPVISNLILIAVVIVLGIAALTYAQNISANYQSDYQESVSSDINKLQETLSFEYGFYNSSNQCVQVYFMNSGSITVDLSSIYLSTSSSSVTYSMEYMNGTQAPSSSLSNGDERQIVVSQTIASGTYITVKITTTRGSSFAYSFTA